MEREALLWKSIPGQKVVCNLCNHYCLIDDGKLGHCQVRLNKEGKLFTLNYGLTSGLAIDPIEKKPFFHFKPGTNVISFGAPGCNFRCLNCQNWDLSQAPRLAGSSLDHRPLFSGFVEILPGKIVDVAIAKACDGYAYTYSEPTIFFEYALDTIREAKVRHQNAYHVFVSNGYFSKQLFELIVKENLLDAIRIDLKFIKDEKYREVTSGSIKPVLANIKAVWESGIHTEVINLIIPSYNDSIDEIRELVIAVKQISPKIPLHFSAFHPDYKLSHIEPTSVEVLLNAKKIAEDEGMEYVYIGNVMMRGVEDTYCPKCRKLLIERNGFSVLKNVFAPKEAQINEKTQVHSNSFKSHVFPVCPYCGYRINIVL